MNIYKNLNTLLFIFVSFFAVKVQGQTVVNLPCQNDTEATKDIDRKDWEIPSGSTTQHSQGFMHNFQLPAAPVEPCKKIQSVEVTLNYNGQDLTAMGSCSYGDYYINVYQGCGNPILPAACPTSNIVFEGPINTLNPVMNFSYGCPSTEFEFGAWFGFDIVPVMAIGSCPEWQSVVSNGQLQLFYDLCVTVTIVDDVIDTPLDLGTDPTVCPGATTTLDASTYDQYEWLPNNETTPTITVGQGIYNVTVTDLNGCTDTDEIEVLQSTLAVNIASTDTDNTICTDQTVTLIANTTPGTTFEWGPNGETSSSINVSPGIYTVTVTETASGCTDDDIIEIFAHPTPPITFDPIAPVACSNGTIPVSVTEVYNTYVWTGALNGNPVNLAPGVHTVTVTDANGCTNSAMINVGSENAANAGNDNNIDVCTDGSLYDIEALLGTHDAGGTWTDINGSGIDININPTATDFSTATAGVYIYDYLVTGTAPCVDDVAMITITVSENNFAGVDNSINICENTTSVDFLTALSNPELGGTWTDINGSGVSLTDPSNVDFTGVISNVYMFSYSFNASGGCLASSSTLTVNVTTGTNAGNDNNIDVCNNGDSYNMDDLLGVHDIPGTWNDDDFSGIDVNLNPFATSFATLSPGTYHYTYTVTGTGTCVDDMATITVEVYNQGDAGVSTTTNICANGGTINFYNEISTLDFGGNWSDQNGTGVDLSDPSNVDMSGVIPSIYMYTYTFDANAGCSMQQSTLTIVVGNNGDAGDNNTQSACEGSTVNLNDLLMNANGAGIFIEVATGTTVTDPNINTTGMAGNSLVYNYQVGTLGDPCGFSVAVLTINVVNNLTAGTSNTLTAPYMACTGDMIDLYTLLTGEDTGGTFADLGGSGGLAANILNTTSIAPGLYQYEYSIGDNVTCPESVAIIDISILESPTVSISADQESLCDDQCTTMYIDFTSTPDFFYALDLYQEDNTLVDIFLLNTPNNNNTITICNDGGIETSPMDTIHLNSTINSWYMYVSSIAGDECNIDYSNGGGDTLRINTQGVKETFIDSTICIHDTIVINSEEYHLLNQMGSATLQGQFCDSIVYVQIDFHTADTTRYENTLCEGDFIMVNSTQYDINNPTDTLTLEDVNGCDSLIYVNLSFYPPVINELDQMLCTGLSIMVNGTQYDETNPKGVEVIPNGALNGCDSTINVNLTFGAMTIIPVNDLLCPDEFLIYNSIRFDINNPKGVALVTGGMGCDTTYNIDLSFHGAAVNDLTGPFCPGYEVTINGTLYNSTNSIGQEILPDMSINGCDSIININLEYATTAMSLLNDELCDDQEIIVNGTIYNFDNQSGTEVIPNGSINGCDSTVVIDLLFNESYDLTEFVNICEGESILIGNMMQSTTGIYPVMYTSIYGCDSIVNTNLNVMPCLEPVVSIAQDNICGNASEGAINLMINEGTTPVNITWTGMNSSTTGNTVVNDISIPFNIPNLISDSYTVIITDATNQEIYNEVLNIADLNPALIADYTIIESIDCSDQTATVEITTQGGTTINNYNWNPNTIGNQSIASNLSPSQYEVIVTDANNCTDSISFTLDAIAPITFETIITDPLCDNTDDGSIEIVNITGGTPSYMIRVDGNVINGTIANNLASGDHDIEIIDNNECMESQTVIIQESQNGSFLGYTLEYNITLGDSILVVGNSSDTGTSYIWSENSALSCLDCPNPFIKPTQTAQYILTATSTNGCIETIAIVVNVEIPQNDVYIPNSFSPNGDGVNDSFEIYAKDIDQILAVKMDIYDRWGNTVFTDQNITGDISWDGTFKGKKVVSGVYIYVIYITDNAGETKVINGNISIIL